jgi:hypothetical protein
LQRENTANFKIRKWITSKVPIGSTIYVEAYMNITNKSEDNEDLPDYIILSDYYINVDKVILEQPEFVFSKNLFKKEQLEKIPNYELEIYTTKLLNQENSFIYILKKKYEILNTNVLYSLYKKFPFCQKINLYNLSSPWGKSLATLNEKKLIFSAPDSILQCELVVSELKQFYLNGRAGFWSDAKSWGVSDGVRMKIELLDESKISHEIFNHYIMPEDDSKIFNINLSPYRNQKLILKFIVSNDISKNKNGDWTVWENPEVVIK